MSRRSARLRNALGNTGFASRFHGHADQCGACLLELDASGDGESLAVVDCCAPKHCFHPGCISTWAEQENSCPLCKKRFALIAVYCASGSLLRVARAQDKDQDFEASQDESDMEDVACFVCERTSDESALMLCDGQAGRCKTACHFYCMGLASLPSGDWFCPPCQEAKDAPMISRSSNANNIAVQSPGAGVPVSHANTDSDRVGVLPVKRERIKIEPLDLEDDEAHDDSNPGASSTGTAMAMQFTQIAEDELAILPPSGAIVKQEPALDTQRPESFSSLGALARGVKLEKTHTQAATNDIAARPQFVKLEPGERDQDDEIVVLRSSRPYKEQSDKAEAKTRVKLEPVCEFFAGEPVDHASSPRPKRAKTNKTVTEPDLGGLCKGLPKWISRQGGLVRIDLGGRGMRDSAALVLAKVVQAALLHIVKSSISSDAPPVALQLAGNHLHRRGVEALAQAAMNAGCRVAHLDLERNRLNAAAAEWLAEWCGQQRGGPPAELYLGYNKVGTDGGSWLLRALGHHARTAQREGRSSRPGPLWVDLRMNGINDPSTLLDELSDDVSVCLALDRAVCGPERCVSSEDIDSGTNIALLHLPGILEQKEESNVEDMEDAGQQPFKRELSPARMKVERCEPLEDLGANGDQARHGGDCRDHFIANAADTDISGGGRSARKGRAGISHAQREGHAKCPPTQTESKSWAQSLGKQRCGEAPSSADCSADAEPLGRGLWDTVNRRKKRPHAQQKRSLRGNMLLNPFREPPVMTLQKVHGEPFSTASATDKCLHGSSASGTAPTAANAVPARHTMPHIVASSSPVPMSRFLPRRAASSENCVARGRSSDEQHKEDDSHVLQGFITELLTLQGRVWLDMAAGERSLRLRCFGNQLYRKACAKYKDIVFDEAGSWAKYLATSQGHHRIAQWVRRKVNEVDGRGKSR